MSFRVSGPKAQTVSRKITKMLVIISISFLILNTPLYFFNVYFYFEKKNRPEEPYSCMEHSLLRLFFLFHWTSFSCNFLLYSISGVMFRNELKKLIYQIFRIKPGVQWGASTTWDIYCENVLSLSFFFVVVLICMIGFC